MKHTLLSCRHFLEFQGSSGFGERRLVLNSPEVPPDAPLEELKAFLVNGDPNSKTEKRKNDFNEVEAQITRGEVEEFFKRYGGIPSLKKDSRVVLNASFSTKVLPLRNGDMGVLSIYVGDNGEAMILVNGFSVANTGSDIIHGAYRPWKVLMPLIKEKLAEPIGLAQASVVASAAPVATAPAVAPIPSAVPAEKIPQRPLAKLRAWFSGESANTIEHAAPMVAKAPEPKAEDIDNFYPKEEIPKDLLGCLKTVGTHFFMSKDNPKVFQDWLEENIENINPYVLDLISGTDGKPNASLLELAMGLADPKNFTPQAIGYFLSPPNGNSPKRIAAIENVIGDPKVVEILHKMVKEKYPVLTPLLSENRPLTLQDIDLALSLMRQVDELGGSGNCELQYTKGWHFTDPYTVAVVRKDFNSNQNNDSLVNYYSDRTRG